MTQWVITNGMGGTGSPKIVEVEGSRIVRDVAGRGITLTQADARLIIASVAAVRAIAESGTCPVLAPGTCYTVGLTPCPQCIARAVIERSAA